MDLFPLYTALQKWFKFKELNVEGATLAWRTHELALATLQNLLFCPNAPELQTNSDEWRVKILD